MDMYFKVYLSRNIIQLFCMRLDFLKQIHMASLIESVEAIISPLERFVLFINEQHENTKANFINHNILVTQLTNARLPTFLKMTRMPILSFINAAN